MTWTLYKEIKYDTDGIPAENLTDFPKLISIAADADITAECSGGGGIKFTSADGMTDLAFGLYPSTDITSGDILARVKVTLLTAANVGDVICRLYYSSTESTTEDKAGTVSADYELFMPLEEDPSGGAPQMLDWVSETNIGTSAGTMTSGDLVAGKVGSGLDFDGSDDQIQTSGLTVSLPLTLEAHCNLSTVTGVLSLLFIGSSGNEVGLLVLNGAAWALTEGLAGNTQATGGTVSVSTWAAIAGTFASSASREAFLNGASVGTNTTSNVASFASAAAMVSSRFTASTQKAIGIIDECRISSVVRSDNWIAYSYTDDFTNTDTFTLSVEQGGGGGSFVLPADAGSYSLTGTDASLEQGYEVQADTGSFSISGVAASLEQGYEIPTDAGEYLITGTEPNLEQSLLLTVDVGLYSITGSAANLEQGIMINPEEGSYVINGVDATLIYGDVLGAEPGEYAISGVAASLEQGYLSSIDVGSYLITGVNANFNQGYEISTDPGSYSLTGTDVNFIEGFGLSADVGNYLITGVSANLLQHSVLNAAVGSYVITGVAANLAINLENIVGGRFIIGQVYYPGFVNAEIFYPGFQQAQVNN